MNIALQAQIDKYATGAGPYQPQYLRQGNFTVALLMTDKREIKAFGVAKRNPEDDPDVPERGEQIALARAVRHLELQQIERLMRRAERQAQTKARPRSRARTRGTGKSTRRQ